jgi:hypothetical protein
VGVSQGLGVGGEQSFGSQPVLLPLQALDLSVDLLQRTHAHTHTHKVNLVTVSM